jgi:hypothetical protein
MQKDEPTPVAGGAASSPDLPDPIENLIDVSEPPSEASPADWQNAGSFDAGSSDDAQPAWSNEPGDFNAIEPFEQNSPETAQPIDVPSFDSNNDAFEPLDMSPASNDDLEQDRDRELSKRETAGDAPTNSGFHAGPKPAPPADFGPASDPLNLNDFANSEISAAKDGPLLFRVLISGIDTREIRDSIREVLEDPRFAWDSNGIFSKISKGHLAINGLSPVKASILITRIKRLPVEIRWEQYAIAQGQP